MKNLFKKKRFYLILFFILAAVLTAVLNVVFLSHPDLTEKYFSQGLYKIISQSISFVFGIFPFSMAEIAIAAAIIFSLFFLISSIIKTVKNFRKKAKKPTVPLLNFITYAICVSCGLYCCFYAFWGFNFARKPLSENLDYEDSLYSVEELADLCRELADEINRLRPQVYETEDGIMRINGSKQDLLDRAEKGYENLAEEIPLFGGNYCRPQYLLSSTMFCYMGITGIFIPYTFEANVNSRTPDCSLPHTVLHEMAHQRGFCREDEANFIAFLACRAHDDIDFKYSGYYSAFIYSINALYGYDAQTASEIRSTVDEGYNRDAYAQSMFWKQFEGPIEEAASSVNNSYLQANGQDDGIHSYGRMVDLLLAERKSRINQD